MAEHSAAAADLGICWRKVKRLSRQPGAGLSGAEDAQGIASAVLIRLDFGGDFQDGIAHGRQAVAAVSLGE